MVQARWEVNITSHEKETMMKVFFFFSLYVADLWGIAVTRDIIRKLCRWVPRWSSMGEQSGRAGAILVDSKGVCGSCRRMFQDTSNPISGSRIAGCGCLGTHADARSRRRVHELISDAVWLPLLVGQLICWAGGRAGRCGGRRRGLSRATG